MLLNKRQEVADFVTNYTAFYGEDTIADTYIKGDTWEKLAKKGEEGAIFRELYIPSLEEPLTEAQKAYNKETIELYKGGTGRIYWYNETCDHEGSNVPLTWEIKDDLVNITYELGVVGSYGYEYDYKTDKLKTVDGSKVFERQ